MPRPYSVSMRMRNDPLTDKEIEIISCAINKITRPKIAALLGINVRTLDKYVNPLIEQGVLPKYKLGGWRGVKKQKPKMPQLTDDERLRRLRKAAEKLL